MPHTHSPALRLSFVLLAALALATTSCSSDKKKCTEGTSECLTESLVRSCVPGGDGNEWFVYQCGTDERCEASGVAPAPVVDLMDAPDSGMSSGTTGSEETGEGHAACVGTCAEGASECIGTAFARHCVDGRTWQLDPCDPGSVCLDGVCKFTDDGGVMICDPGERSCASTDVERVCATDGSGWVESDCEEGEACLIDRCAADPDASCDEESRCLDNKTALRCLGRDRGFEVVTCEGDTWCEMGRCRGNACVLGSLCVAQNQLRKCIAGEKLVDEQCAVNEVCRQDRDVGKCVPRNCDPGTVRCGDPRDPKVDDTKFYAKCAPGTETPSGVPEWVVTECDGLLTCDPTFAATGNPCRQDCTPGAETCKDDPLSPISDGWTVCKDDGTWGPVTRCDEGAGKFLQCVLKPNPDASELPAHLCAEPVCAWVIENADPEDGSCIQGQLQSCNTKGELRDPADCAVGICVPTSLVAQADGRLPGACDEELECIDGEEQCVYDGLLPTPLFRKCVDGVWEAKLRTCANDDLCLDYIDDEGLWQKLCGADCAPHTRRCNISDQLETCGDAGTWGSAVDCDTGICQTTGGSDAACVLECLPGGVECSGTPLLASDGVNMGTTMEAVCDKNGQLGTETMCPAGEACRESRFGESIGCVECLGPTVLGGNDFGYADTRCDPADTDKVQECADTNDWKSSRACGAGKACVGAMPDTCGMCLSDMGNSVVCTQTNVNEQHRCGSCYHAMLAMTLTNCTQTAIVAVNAALTCTMLFGDDPAVNGTTGVTSWGGFADCCDGSTTKAAPFGQFLLQSTCSTVGQGFPTAFGGEPDCCSTARIFASGPDFAYCGF